MSFHVTQVTTPEQLEIAQAIRSKVFIEEQGFSREIELDGKDELPTTRHFIGKDTELNKYVAVARALLSPESRKAKIGRVGVLREYRGKKYGAVIMHELEKALSNEYDTFLLSSQYDKRYFYEKCGYTYVNNEVYLEEGVQHCMMIKTIASESM